MSYIPFSNIQQGILLFRFENNENWRIMRHGPEMQYLSGTNTHPYPHNQQTHMPIPTPPHTQHTPPQQQCLFPCFCFVLFVLFFCFCFLFVCLFFSCKYKCIRFAVATWICWFVYLHWSIYICVVHWFMPGLYKGKIRNQLWGTRCLITWIPQY